MPKKLLFIFHQWLSLTNTGKKVFLGNVQATRSSAMGASGVGRGPYGGFLLSLQSLARFETRLFTYDIQNVLYMWHVGFVTDPPLWQIQTSGKIKHNYDIYVCCAYVDKQ